MKTLERVKFIQETFRYVPETGDLYWREDRPRNHYKRDNSYTWYMNKLAGTQVQGTINAHGYKVVSVFPQILAFHLIAFVVMEGRFPEGTLDHWDGDPLNNRWSNLREVPQAINARNQCKNSRNTSGLHGVYWSKARESWYAQVYYQRKHIFLGYHPTKEVAAQVRQAWLDKHPELGYSSSHGKREDPHPEARYRDR